MNSQVFGTKFSGARNESSAATVQEVHPQSQDSRRSRRCENEFINKFISNQTPARIYVVNGYQEHGLIHAHDDQILVVIPQSDCVLKLMYKHALTTIEKYKSSEVLAQAQKAATKNCGIQFPKFSESNSSCAKHEKYWLDNFIRSRCHLKFFTIGGVPIPGIITDYDDECIVIVDPRSCDDKKIVYKRTLSTIEFVK